MKERITLLSERVKKANNISTEEATKTAIIMPFFQVLGYDVFNPDEFTPEFVADVGIKKGEKVDYAILKDGKPAILIEAKPMNEKLDKHDSQLFRYFATTESKFAILTNGITYKFYTDLDQVNKMDESPFFQFHLFEFSDYDLDELAKFSKDKFDSDKIYITAGELKYTTAIKSFFANQIEEPEEHFVSFIASQVYSGKKTKQTIEKFSDLVKKSLKQYLYEYANETFRAAISKLPKEAENHNQEAIVEERKTKDVITTTEELQGFSVIRVTLKDIVDIDRISYRDNNSYFNVLLDNSIRKWICRLYFSDKRKSIQLNDENCTTYTLQNVEDIIYYKDKIHEVSKKVLSL